MFAITADQVDSRHRPDIAAATMLALESLLGAGLVLPVDRTAGDEIQLLLDTADTALTAILALTRDGEWSVGCGIGDVTIPLPKNAREAGGAAFVAAREAVNDAKRRDTRFALRSPATTEAADAEAFVDLLLNLRGRRSTEGWEICDLLLAGNSQAEAAKQLGITPQAASKRARSAALRVEFAARSPLERRLAAVDLSAGEGRTS
ncbi:DNA-binding protein [Glaciihabitans sp. INWT7]|uniref:DNA-binding protein n=1 Tax=Glaciihabitans sp. INWT7 TaxID=2596912 RepID=UPI001623F1C5|nr:DNA-binding protein [Glaciihabitans sp. INWT7]QNE47703.1 DNA-binding protein [Glaciihabitans sp. INWT7]